MHLKWYGHASFRLTDGRGTSVVTDPYDPATSGYKTVTEPADIVVISSSTDRFHCNAHLIPGEPVVIDALALARQGGERVERAIPFRAIEAMEARDHAYHDPDQNGMYRFEMDGISVGHLGDVGNPLSAAQMAFFEGVDLLLALAGGHPTIGLDDLDDVIRSVQPKLVVPMHFRTLTYRPRNSFWISTFIDRYPPEQVDFAFAPEVDLHPIALPDHTRILVLDYV